MTEAELQKMLVDKSTTFVMNLSGKFSHIVSDRFLAIMLACYMRTVLQFDGMDLQTAAGDTATIFFEYTLMRNFKVNFDATALRNQYVVMFLDVEYKTGEDAGTTNNN